MADKHSNIRPHYYDGLDSTSQVSFSLSLRELAERIENLNYGTQRFLSHLVDVRREALKRRIEGYRAKGDEDVARYAERAGDALADGIEALLNDGLY